MYRTEGYKCEVNLGGRVEDLNLGDDAIYDFSRLLRPVKAWDGYSQSYQK